MDHRLRQPASHWRASRSPHASCPYSGAERRELPAQAIEGKAAVCDPTRRRGRLGGRSRDRRNHPRFLKATAAPATKPRPSPPGRPWRVVLDAHAANWPVFAPPQWPAFTPPLTLIDDILDMQIPCVSLFGCRPNSNELSSHLVELLFGNQRSFGPEEIMVGLELLRREIGTNG